MHIASKLPGRGAAAASPGRVSGRWPAKPCSIAVTDAAAGLPVFRPLVGLDKEEIIRLARRVRTYEFAI